MFLTALEPKWGLFLFSWENDELYCPRYACGETVGMECCIFETMGQILWSLVRVFELYFCCLNSDKAGVYFVGGGESCPINSCLYSFMKAFLLILPNFELPKVDWWFIQGFRKSFFCVFIVDPASICYIDLVFEVIFEEMEWEKWLWIWAYEIYSTKRDCSESSIFLREILPVSLLTWTDSCLSITGKLDVWGGYFP